MPDTSLTGKKSAELLDGVAAERGYPKSITVDNGTEFYSQAMVLELTKASLLTTRHAAARSTPSRSRP